jgi:hypothetical protein
MPRSPDDRLNETDVVISLPHSGTRTLQSWLAEHRKIRGFRTETVGAWHFTHHPHQVSKFLMLARNDPGSRRAYVPVRNPIDVADSWERRYRGNDAHNGFNMTNGIAQMVDHYLRSPECIELFKMEELPRLRGHGPQPHDWEKIGAEHERVRSIRDFFRKVPEVESFYRELYTPEELWWLG